MMRRVSLFSSWLQFKFFKNEVNGAHIGSTHTKTGMIQRRLAWPLHKDDRKIHEALHIKKRGGVCIIY